MPLGLLGSRREAGLLAGPRCLPTTNREVQIIIIMITISIISIICAITIVSSSTIRDTTNQADPRSGGCEFSQTLSSLRSRCLEHQAPESCGLHLAAKSTPDKQIRVLGKTPSTIGLRVNLKSENDCESYDQTRLYVTSHLIRLPNPDLKIMSSETWRSGDSKVTIARHAALCVRGRELRTCCRPRTCTSWRQ